MSQLTGVAKVGLTSTPGQVEKILVIAGANDEVQEGVGYLGVNLANATGATLSPYASNRLFVDGTEAQ